jgi:hypothetical protein
MTHEDALGNEIEVGDTILYYTLAGKSAVAPTIRKVFKVGVTKKGEPYIKAHLLDHSPHPSGGRIVNLYNCVIMKKHDEGED